MQPKVETMSISAILSDSNEWNFNPKYQRNYVWSEKSQSALIETIFDDFPIGGAIFLVSAGDDERYMWEVLDGKQRICTFKKFNESKLVFRALNKEKYADIDGKVYDDMPQHYKKKFKNYQLSVVKLDEEIINEENVKTMFERINTCGKKLTAAEIRHSKMSAVGDMIVDAIDEFDKFNKNVSESISKYILKTAKHSRYADEGELATLLAKAYYIIECDGKNIGMAGNKFADTFYGEDFDDDALAAIKKRTLSVLKKLKENLDKPLQSLNEIDGLFAFLYCNYNSISWYMISKDKNAFNKSIEEIIEEYRKYRLISGGECHRGKSFYERYKIAREKMQPFVITKDQQRYFTRAQREEAWNTRERVCAICGKPINFFEEMDLDHKVAWNNGGTTTLDNAQITCAHCNRSKKDATPVYKASDVA